MAGLLASFLYGTAVYEPRSRHLSSLFGAAVRPFVLPAGNASSSNRPRIVPSPHSISRSDWRLARPRAELRRSFPL